MAKSPSEKQAAYRERQKTDRIARNALGEKVGDALLDAHVMVEELMKSRIYENDPRLAEVLQRLNDTIDKAHAAIAYGLDFDANRYER